MRRGLKGQAIQIIVGVAWFTIYALHALEDAAGEHTSFMQRADALDGYIEQCFGDHAAFG